MSEIDFEGQARAIFPAADLPRNAGDIIADALRIADANCQARIAAALAPPVAPAEPPDHECPPARHGCPDCEKAATPPAVAPRPCPTCNREGKRTSRCFHGPEGTTLPDAPKGGNPSKDTSLSASPTRTDLPADSPADVKVRLIPEAPRAGDPRYITAGTVTVPDAPKGEPAPPASPEVALPIAVNEAWRDSSGRPIFVSQIDRERSTVVVLWDAGRGSVIMGRVEFDLRKVLGFVRDGLWTRLLPVGATPDQLAAAEAKGRLRGIEESAAVCEEGVGDWLPNSTPTVALTSAARAIRALAQSAGAGEGR